MNFYHHSRQIFYREPQGAAPISSSVTLRARLDLPAGSEVFVRLWVEDAGETLFRMDCEDGIVTATIPLPDTPRAVWYHFLLRMEDGRTLRYGAPSGEGYLYHEGEPPSYQITVYDPAFTTPKSWCAGLCYQIFPDRYRRSSLVRFQERAEAHRAIGRTVRLHENWSDAPASTPEPGEVDYVPNDFFGGDFLGIIEKLDDIQALGVTHIYLNPIFESCSNHRYNTADYLRPDPILGTEEEFEALLVEAGKRGIRVILDGVFSHTGSDSRYFNLEGHYGTVGAARDAASPYRSWYRFTAYPDEYECWWGFRTLPNVDELNPAYADFITGEDGVLSHWTKKGLGGWRLDVADELPDAFIRMIRARLKQVDPEAVLIGEVWEDCANKFGPEGRRDYVDGDLLDGAMNYPFAEFVTEYLTGKKTATEFCALLGGLREHYPKPFFDACMNLLSSHDDVRLLYKLAGAPPRYALSRDEQRDYVPAPEALILGKRRTPLAFLLQVCLPGVPTLYYGDEAGMMGMADPFNRATYPWGAEDQTIWNWAKRIFPLRRRFPCLQSGRFVMAALGESTVAIVRFIEDGQLAILLINGGETSETVHLSKTCFIEGEDADSLPALAGSYCDVFSNETISLQRVTAFTLEPISFRFLVQEESSCSDSE